MAQIKFGGRDRTLKYRLSSAVTFEDATDTTITEALPKMGVRTLATLLWLGMRAEDERLSVAKVLDQLDAYVEEGGDLADLWRAVTDQLAVDGLFGKDAAEKQKGKADAGGAA